MHPQADHAEEVLDMILPAGHQPANVMEPSEKPLHPPTSAVTAQKDDRPTSGSGIEGRQAAMEMPVKAHHWVQNAPSNHSQGATLSVSCSTMDGRLPTVISFVQQVGNAHPLQLLAISLVPYGHSDRQSRCCTKKFELL
jgi:hypothetical protein